MTTTIERVNETRMLENIESGKPPCCYEGRMTMFGRLIPEQCTNGSDWAAFMPSCGHQETYCTPHRTYLDNKAFTIFCMCKSEQRADEVVWRML